GAARGLIAAMADHSPPQFCDVALPVPLNLTFTYRVNGAAGDCAPVVGGRVLVPFRSERLAGVVTALHDREPAMKAREVLHVLDAAPVLDSTLMELAAWISEYYVCPIGEVFRSMLPLAAEVKRVRQYRITQAGIAALMAAAEQGSSLRSRRTPEEQQVQYAVLNRLSDADALRESSLRTATGASRELLAGMIRKKWITREDASAPRDTPRKVRVLVLNAPAAVQPGTPEHAPADADPANHAPAGSSSLRSPDKPLIETEIQGGSLRKKPRITREQQRVIEAVQSAGGRMMLEASRSAGLSASSIQTLVRRGDAAIIEEPADFAVSTLTRARSPLAFELNHDQTAALEHIRAAVRNAHKVKAHNALPNAPASDDRPPAASGLAALPRFSATLLHGVTGSGKTAVYLSAMREVMEAGRSAILLVPEIGLTPAMAADVAHVFGPQVAILHSALTREERAEQWHRIHRGEARIVVGTRSAIFAPVADLALIIVDEEHDGSYKQEEAPRYHARDVAAMRGKLAGAAVVLGSATPSLESFYNARQGKYALVEMRQRVEQRPLPEFELVDMRGEFALTGRDEVLSRRLTEEITERLARGEQTLILLNRRGYSPVVLCRTCGKSLECRNCAIPMTHHKRKNALECHYCGFRRDVPAACPECGSEYIFFVGTGSEKLEELLHGLFPRARVERLDRDTVRRRDDFERVLGRLHAGEIDILVGTQMIAKGHDIHGITLVGIVGADVALGFPDFRAAERTFQLITQVAGRAGRGGAPGRVILQTYFPDHYAIQYAAAHDYLGFAEKELRFRRWMHYPPFTSLANVIIRSEDLEQALAMASALGRWFENAIQSSSLPGSVPGPGWREQEGGKREGRLRVLGPAA
ncbi:MAG TPA: primosomal protein N', partial [Terriglobales bacterium]|nr:primosomal protein N' [Terriglobales bacterium]